MATYKVRLHAYTRGIGGGNTKRQYRKVTAGNFYMDAGAAVFQDAAGKVIHAFGAGDWYQIRKLDDAT